MKYSNSYKCDPNSGKLVCSCIVTPERREQLESKEKEEEAIQKEKERLEQIKAAEPVMEANWEPPEGDISLMSDAETEEFCVPKCSNYQGLAFVTRNKLYGWFSCGCKYIGAGGDDQYYDYITKLKLRENEPQRRIQTYESYFEGLCIAGCRELSEDPEFGESNDQVGLLLFNGICQCWDEIDSRGAGENVGEFSLIS